MLNKWCKWIPTCNQTCSKWLRNKSNRCKWCSNSRCSSNRFSWIAWETKSIWVRCLPNNNKLTNSTSTNNSSNSNMLSKWWLQATTIRINLLIKMVCPSAQSNTSRLCSNNSNMDRNKLITVKKLCRTLINSITCKSKDKKKIPFKRRFKRLYRSVLTTMHSLVILSSQLATHLFITTRKVHLNTHRICQSLIGKDHKKFPRKKSQKCRLIQKTLEI